MLLLGSIANSQNIPVAIRIGERPVSLEEFRYFYGKNGQGSTSGDLKQFVKAFVDYQLKVQAAFDAHLDASLIDEARFQSVSDSQNLNLSFHVSKSDEAVKVAHILVPPIVNIIGVAFGPLLFIQGGQNGRRKQNREFAGTTP